MRQSVEIAEQNIAVDPVNPFYKNRIEIDGIVYDTSEYGVMVTYTIEEGEIVYLTFWDLYNA